MGGGSQNINITGVNCGPGHGISIGSIGKSTNDSSVSGIHVSDCTMSNTQNGVRIKTYTTDCAATVSDVTFQQITVDQSKYPIIIDQNYCGGHQTCIVCRLIHINYYMLTFFIFIKFFIYLYVFAGELACKSK